MRLLADLHTHTVASGHAFSTITELATAAAGKGLELIAFTDHGPSVPGGCARVVLLEHEGGSRHPVGRSHPQGLRGQRCRH